MSTAVHKLFQDALTTWCTSTVSLEYCNVIRGERKGHVAPRYKQMACKSLCAVATAVKTLDLHPRRRSQHSADLFTLNLDLMQGALRARHWAQQNSSARFSADTLQPEWRDTEHPSTDITF
jgi:hypothetical protein